MSKYTIPKLAKGTIVPSFKAFFAIPHPSEHLPIETPIEHIKNAMEEFIKENGIEQSEYSIPITIK